MDHNEIFVSTKTDPSFEMNIHDPSVDQFVSANIKEHKIWEYEQVHEVLDALSKYPDAYFLGLGTIIGMFTLAAAAHNRQILSFEPNVKNYGRICKTVNKNSFHKNVNLFNFAATSKAQKLRQEPEEKNMGGSAVKPVTKDDLSKDGIDVVSGLPLDSLNLPTERPIVMKMDIEGHELDALMGATKFLQDVNIVFAMMELRPDQLHENEIMWKKMLDIFASKGLQPFRHDGFGNTQKLDVDKFLSWTARDGYQNNAYYDVFWK